MKYQPPYSAADVRRVYGVELLNHLFDDPCHRWRMETGIELIHREPTKDELLRIVENWRLMDEDQKRISDAKSKELFGVDNMSHARQLLRLFDLPTPSAVLLNRSARFHFERGSFAALVQSHFTQRGSSAALIVHTQRKE